VSCRAGWSTVNGTENQVIQGLWDAGCAGGRAANDRQGADRHAGTVGGLISACFSGEGLEIDPNGETLYLGGYDTARDLE
jgi:hypothetical protein